jgi:adenine/guanine phosphoribosyltransferase-like PRPP-binding protein
VNSAAIEQSFLIASSLNASCQLVQQLHATVLECLVVIELVDLKGRENVKAPVHSLIQF